MEKKVTSDMAFTLLDNVAGGLVAGQIAGNGTANITITGATLTQINATLVDANGITFVPTADYNGSAVVTVTTNDGALTDTDNSTITINAINDAPVLSDVSASTAYTQNDTAVVIDASATIVDVDDTNIESATVAITGGEDFVAGGGIDALNYSTLHGVTGVYDPATGILALTGSATLAQYEQILESVTFSSTSDTTGNRTISYRVNDGTTNSNTQTATITYSLPPTLTGVLNDQNTAANQAANAWIFDASTAFGGVGTYSLTVTNYSGGAVTGYSIDSSTGIITNTAAIPNTSTAVIFTVTRTSGTSVSETFDLFTNAAALTGASTTGNDTITGAAAARVWGNNGNDSITGTSKNRIHGGDGNDTISLTASNSVFGGAGDDSISSSGTGSNIYGGDGNVQ